MCDVNKNSQILLSEKMSKWYLEKLKEHNDDKGILMHLSGVDYTIKQQKTRIEQQDKYIKELEQINLDDKFKSLIEAYYNLKDSSSLILNILKIEDKNIKNNFTDLNIVEADKQVETLTYALTLADTLLRTKINVEMPVLFNKLDPKDEYVEMVKKIK